MKAISNKLLIYKSEEKVALTNHLLNAKTIA